jgi:peroxiredoxin Q/BCP
MSLSLSPRAVVAEGGGDVPPVGRAFSFVCARRFPPLISFLLLGACLLGGVGVALGQSHARGPSVGSQAPDFTLPYATADTIVFEGEPLREAVRRGPVVLFFYPADWSPGCTREVCTLRDAFGDLARLGTQVWGISGDYVFSHRTWAEHHQLPFRLLSDHRHEVALAYGSYDSERGFNRRTVFVVGRDGRIAYADDNYSVADEADFAALRAWLAASAREDGK